MKEVEAKRCLVELNPTGCNLASCRQRCLQLKNGNGVYVDNGKGDYQFNCFYNC